MARTKVEDCLALDLCELTRPGPLRRGFGGVYRFFKDGKEIDSIPWEFIGDSLRLHCSERVMFGDPIFYTEWVKVTYTDTQFGGKRAWLQCPLCEKRVRKLFSPPVRYQHFLCRECHDLTYKSQQRESHKWFDLMEGSWFAAKLEQSMGWDINQAPEEEADPLAFHAAHERNLSALLEYALGRGPFPPDPLPGRKRRYRRTRPFLKGEPKSPSEHLCMRCRDYREIEAPQPVTLSNGRSALRGRCPVCGATMTAIVKGR